MGEKDFAIVNAFKGTDKASDIQLETFSTRTAEAVRRVLANPENSKAGHLKAGRALTQRRRKPK